MRSLKNKGIYMLSGAVLMLAASCQEEANDYTPTQPPIDGYVLSSDVAPTNLVAYWSFDNTTKESKSNLEGTSTNVSYEAGMKGQALKGSETGMVTYAGTPGTGLGSMTSFTTTMWMKTDKHMKNAQAVFTLPRTSDFWGNMFMLIEPNTGTEDKMFMKIGYGGQWAEFNGDNRLNGIYGKWTHLAFSYNAATSKFSMYVNGTALTLPASITDRKNGATPPAPLGNLSLPDVSRFIFGGYQQHLGGTFGAPDPGWMGQYTGLLDEMRIYNKALDAKDIGAIFKLEAKGR